MKRSKPVKSLLALILAAAAAVTGWQGWKSWRRWTGRGQVALTPGDAQPSSVAAAADPTALVAPPRVSESLPTAETDVQAPEAPPPTSIAEDEASGLRADQSSPETATEIADLLPDPDLAPAGPGDEVPLTLDAPSDEATPPTAATEPSNSAPEPAPVAGDGVDQVLEVLAAEADAREPSTIASRFGPNAVAADEGGDCPPDHPVKGNTNSMIFHLPGQSSYGATMAEVCFSDGDAAETAGFRPRKR